MCPGASSAPRPRRRSSLEELLLLVDGLRPELPLEPGAVAELPDELTLPPELAPLPPEDLPDEPLPDEPDPLFDEPDELLPSLACADRLPADRSAAESRAINSGETRRE